MRIQQSHEREARLAGFFVVLIIHGAVLYSLWQDRLLPPPSQTATVFVDLLKDSAKPEPAKPALSRSQPVKLNQARLPEPLPAQQLVAQAPAVSPSEPAAPPLLPPKIEAPVEPAPLPPPPANPAGPAVMSGELAVACPESTPPSYPVLSRRLGEEGKVVLRVELDETGLVDRATIKTSSGYARLDEAALSAVRHWRCNPAKRDDVAVRAVAIQPFNFVLEGR